MPCLAVGGVHIHMHLGCMLYGWGVLRVPFERIQIHYLMQSLMHYLRVGSGFEVLETDCDGVDRRSCCFIDPDFL